MKTVQLEQDLVVFILVVNPQQDFSSIQTLTTGQSSEVLTMVYVIINSSDANCGGVYVLMRRCNHEQSKIQISKSSRNSNTKWDYLVF